MQLLLRASHPPAAATTLLVTLGGLQPSLAALASFAGGVLAVVIVGEIARRLTRAGVQACRRRKVPGRKAG